MCYPPAANLLQMWPVTLVAVVVQAFFLDPIQRIPRYELLFTAVRKRTDEDHKDYPHIVAMLQIVNQLAKRMNDIQRDCDARKQCLLLAGSHSMLICGLYTPPLFSTTKSIRSGIEVEGK